jgi:hypothetical protein
MKSPRSPSPSCPLPQGSKVAQEVRHPACNLCDATACRPRLLATFTSTLVELYYAMAQSPPFQRTFLWGLPSRETQANKQTKERGKAKEQDQKLCRSATCLSNLPHR